MPKKKFIDKKKAVTFHLLHRSQRDPLAADESAPQRVLFPVTSQKSSKRSKNKEEEMKYGIYFDDDYDYLQHLRQADRNQVEWIPSPKCEEVDKHNISLPSSLFASNVEEKVGLLNKAAPQSGLRLDLDPDIIAAMDEDFDYVDPNNELEDNFIELANASSLEKTEEDEDGNSMEEDELDNTESSVYSSEIEDDIGSLRNFDTQSRFTDYSLSSSVISRNSNLTLLDDTFEQMFTNYNESEIGALECEEIEGEMDSESQIFKAAIDEFDRSRTMKKLSVEDLHKIVIDSSEESEVDNEYLFEIKPKENWDCESILSTYSNIYNHPKLIPEPTNKIQVSKRTGIPMISGKLTKKALAQLDDSTTTRNCSSVISSLSLLSIRDKNETREKKKTRKQQLKDYKKMRRIERKANANAFKEEKKNLEKIMIHNQLNRRGISL